MKLSNLTLVFWLLALLGLQSPLFASSENEVPLTIADPFIEMHTGPAAAYPIFHVIDRGEQIVILKRRTTWFKIRAENGKEGWASQLQMEHTLQPGGEQVKFAEIDENAFSNRRWEVGMTGGELEDAPVMSIYTAYAFTENFSTEFTLGHSVGNVSSTNLYKLNLLMQPFPSWEYSPFFTLGLGQIDVNPSATLIEPAIKSNQMSQLGFGVRTHITRRFILRFELNEYVIFSASNDKDENEDITEWKLGFAVFF